MTITPELEQIARALCVKRGHNPDEVYPFDNGTPTRTVRTLRPRWMTAAHEIAAAYDLKKAVDAYAITRNRAAWLKGFQS